MVRSGDEAGNDREVPARPRKRVLAAGDVCMDIILAGLPHLPRAEEDTQAQEMATVVGGQTATIARALCRLGMQVSLVSRLGDDAYGRSALEQLARDGVDTAGVVIDKALRTGATVVLSTGRERALATYMGSLSELRREDIRLDLLAGADHLHVGSYFLHRALHPDMAGLFREAKRLGLTTSVDPGWDSFEDWGCGLLDILPDVDVFLPNEVEALAITRRPTLEEAMDALLEHGNTVVVKRGGKGCLAGRGRERIESPAFAVPVVDVTSAGDVFNAGSLYGLLSCWDLERSARFANACGAIAVSRIGSTGVIAGVAEVVAFLSCQGREAPYRSLREGE